MAGPAWNDDLSVDLARIGANCAEVLWQVKRDAPFRLTPTLVEVRRWHEGIYEGCSVPSSEYVGHFRGDGNYPDLVDYEVGLGPFLSDGRREKEGVRSDRVVGQLTRFISWLEGAVATLDGVIADGSKPTSTDELRAVVTLIALVHGEWVRIHPFANGNGRTARMWACWAALRYGLPAFVEIKPRPADGGYGRASSASMGRPPDFVGDHRPAITFFGDLLALYHPT